jgi:hypothetical protein
MKSMSQVVATCVALISGISLFAGQASKTWQSPNRRNLDPQSQPTLIVRTEGLSISVDPSPYPFILRIRRERDGSGQPEEIKSTISEDIIQIDQIVVWNDRIVLRGLANSAIAVVEIFDISGTHIDKFFCYWPAISEARGVIVFTKMYPTHFASGTEDHYMAYFLSMSPRANRSSKVSSSDSSDVGMALYPPSVGNAPLDNVDLTGSLHSQPAAGFFWSDAGDYAVTFDEFLGGDRLILFHFGNSSITVDERPVGVDDLCANGVSKCHPHYYLRDCKFLKDSSGVGLAATFGYPQSEFGTVVKLSPSQFRRIAEKNIPTEPKRNTGANDGE